MRCSICNEAISTKRYFETRGFAAFWTSKEDFYALSQKVRIGPPLSVVACRPCVLQRFRTANKLPVGPFILAVLLAAGGTWVIVFLKRNDPDIQWQPLLLVALLSWSLLLAFAIGFLNQMLRKGEPVQSEVDSLLSPMAEALVRDMPEWNTFITRTAFEEMRKGGFNPGN